MNDINRNRIIVKQLSILPNISTILQNIINCKHFVKFKILYTFGTAQDNIGNIYQNNRILCIYTRQF